MYLNRKTHLAILYQALYNRAPKWRDIGLFLKLDPDKLNVIKSNETDVHSRLEGMLSLWLNQVDPSPTKPKIVAVLRKLELNAEAEELDNELQ